MENAIQHLFDCNSKKWTQQPIQVKIDTESFASGMSTLCLFCLCMICQCALHCAHVTIIGSLRKAYYLRIISEPSEVYVAKISIDPSEDRETYYQDVETQMYAKKVRMIVREVKVIYDI